MSPIESPNPERNGLPGGSRHGRPGRTSRHSVGKHRVVDGKDSRRRRSLDQGRLHESKVAVSAFCRVETLFGLFWRVETLLLRVATRFLEERSWSADADGSFQPDGLRPLVSSNSVSQDDDLEVLGEGFEAVEQRLDFITVKIGEFPLDHNGDRYAGL